MMIKKIFKVIGLVLAGVATFSGGVFGVMAVMGKFETPTVYPEEIHFANSEKTIVADSTNSEKVYSFSIEATNSTEKYPVNQTQCQIWFVSGADLIELCKEDGTEWDEDKIKNKFYIANVNENIYFKLKTLSDAVLATKDNKVVLNARTDNDQSQVQSSNKQTIYIDRSATSLYVKNIGEIPNGTDAQEKTIGLGAEVVLNDYVVTPTYSLNPYTDANGARVSKDIELYFDGTTKHKALTEFLLVNEQTASADATLREVLTFEDGKIIFKVNQASLVDTYNFKVAMFRTYQDKLDYEASAENNGSISARLGHMLTRDIKITVVNEEIASISMTDAEITLSLYEADTLLMNTAGTQPKDINLSLKMYKSNSTLDTTRYDELDFLQETDDLKFVGRIATFVNENDVNDKISTNDANFDATKLVVGNFEVFGYRVVEKYVVDSKNYYCNNGMAVILADKVSGTSVASGAEVSVLKSNSYLMFCTKTDGVYSLDATFDYEVEKTGQTFELTTKTVPTADTYLCAFVVNNGKNIPSNLFVGTKINVSEYALTFTRAQETATLNISYDANGISTIDSLNFTDFVTDIKASYKACIFITKDLGNIVAFDGTSLDEISMLIEGERYYIVGSKDANGKFQNIVKAKENANATNGNSTQLYVLQLQNDCGESTEDYMTKVLAGTKTLEPKDPTMTSQYMFDVCVEYKFDKDLFQVSLPVGTTNIYEGGSYALELTTQKNADLIKLFYDFYDLGTDYADYIKSSDENYFTINSVAYDDVTKVLSVGITCNKSTVGLTDKPYLKVLDEKIYELAISSSKPDTICYVYDSGSVDLPKNANNLLENSYIKVDVSWDGTNYTYTPQFVTAGYTGTVRFNDKVAMSSTGFQDKDFKVEHLVEYSSGNTDIFTIDGDGQNFKAVYCGETYLKVTIAGESAYIKVKVNKGDFVATPTSSTVLSGGKLGDFETFTFDGTDIIAKENAVEIKNLRVVSYGKIGAELSCTEEDGAWSCKDGTTEILKIAYDTTNGWTFARTSSIYTSLTIEFNMHSIVVDEDIQVEITSGVTAELNSAEDKNWILDGKVVLYKDTKVDLLYKITTGSLENYSQLIGLKSTTELTLNVYLDSAEITGYNAYVVTADCGEHTIYVKCDGATLFEQKVYVVPNAVATANIEELTANKDIAMSTFGLKAHSTAVTYGNGAIYRQDNLSQVTDFSNYTVEFGDENLTGTITSANLVVAMKKIGTITTDVTIKCDGNAVLTYKNIAVTNNYSVEAQNVPASKKYSFMALTEYDIENYFKLKNGTNYDDEYTLTSMEITSGNETIALTLDATNKKFTISAIGTNYENVTITLTYTKSGATDLCYSTLVQTDFSIDVLAYTPTTNSYTIKTGSNFNLIGGIYTIDTNIISQISVENIYVDQAGTEETAVTGFVKGLTESSVTFQDFEGSEKIVYVEYKLTYKDTTITYTYLLPVTVTNRETITLTYPMKDLTFVADDVTFVSEKEQTNFGTTAHNYEPVAINKTASKTINLCTKDTQLDVTRIITADFKNLELVGYSNLLHYYKQGVEVSNGTITLPTCSTEAFGYLIFKVTTNSLNYDYYTLYVCTTEVAKDANINAELNSANGINIIENIKGNVTIANYGYAYDEKISFYYLSSSSLATYTSGLTEYSKISSSNVFTHDGINYASLKFVVLYTYGYHIYPLGTLTIHLQPTVAETVASGYNNEISGISNGKYEREFTSVVTTINNPFDKTISSIELKTLDGTTLATGSDKMFSTSSGTITINQFKTTAYSFVAIYTTSDGLKLQVTYTLYPVTVTEPTNDAKTVGEFDGTKFNNSVTIASIIGANYSGAIEINNSTYTDTTYTFDQSAQDQAIVLTIKFTNLLDENDNAVTKNYKFKVLKALDLAQNGINNGATSSTALATTVGTSYTTVNGNSLSVSKKTASGVDTYIIGSDSLGQTINVVSGSTLKLYFGTDSQYLNNPTGTIEITSGTSLYFTHMATSRVISALVEITDGTNVYTTYDLYINLQKSYTGLIANYSEVDADHENLKENDSTITDLFAMLFTSNDTLSGDTRLSLMNNNNTKVASTSVDFEAMGFNDKNNPNYMIFSAGTEQKISVKSDNKTLLVDSVDENTANQYLRISNNAGMEDLDYNFQVMDGTSNEGFNFDIDETLGLYEDNKVSITAGADKIVYLGKLNDLISNLFNIENVTPTNETISVDDESISVKCFSFDALDGKTVYLYYDSTTNSVYTKLDDFGSAQEKTVTVTATATTGNVFDELTITFYDYQISKTYESTYDTQMALDIIGVDTFVAKDSALKLAFESIKYSFNSQGLQNSSTDADNTLVEFDNTNQLLSFKNIGSAYAYAEITFKVQKDAQTIQKFTYTVKIERAMQFVVNNQDFGSASASEIETYLQLGSNQDYVLNESKDAETLASGKTYYSALYISLANRNISADSAMSWTALVDVDCADYSDIVTYTASTKTLQFIKDYTGDLELKLTVDLGTNGKYVMNYIVHVQGNVSVAYVSTAGENCILTGDDYYTSNTAENVIGNAVSLNAHTTNLTTGLSISHMIFEINDTTNALSNKELFDTGTEVADLTDYQISGTGAMSKSVTLADVPVSDINNKVPYRVVYKVVVTKSNGFATEEYYVSYLVVNTVPITEHSANVCIGGTNSRLYNSKWLDLFYYNYNDGNPITYYENGNIKSVFSCSFTGTTAQTQYNSFVTNKVIGIGDYYFKLEQISGNRYGIDLTDKYTNISCESEYKDSVNNLFTNEYIGTLTVYSNGEPIITLPAYTGTTGFRLYTDVTITAKSSMKIKNIFNSYSTQIPDTLKEESIIGIGTATTDWVNNATSISAEESAGTITVESTTYTIKELTYTSASAISGICGITATYYAVIGATKVVVVDYNYTGSVGCFEVQNGQDFDLANGIKTYSMSSNKLTVAGTAISNVTDVDGAGITYSSGKLTQATPDGKKHTLTVATASETFTIYVKFLAD